MTEAGKQESKHVGAGQTPMCESWKILTLPWLFGRALRYGSEKERFPCWCVLMRLELVGPATACLAVDLERRDYLLQLLSSLLPPPNATFIKGTGDFGSVSPSSQSGCFGVKVAPDSTDTEQTPSHISRSEGGVRGVCFTQSSWQQ